VQLPALSIFVSTLKTDDGVKDVETKQSAGNCMIHNSAF